MQKSIITPPYLQPGDAIGLVCPAGYMPTEKFATCIQTLQDWGYQTVVGKTPGHQYHYFAGTDAERLADLQQMLDDDNIKAILCARGGYGTSRIIDEVNWKKFKANPKWIIGFSDVTVLHSCLLTQLQTASLHAPMAAAFNDGNAQNEYIQSLRDALCGKPLTYKTTAHPANRKGNSKGVLAGGNLALLAHQIGTATDINTDGKILFIEDIGEYYYATDRLLVQLQRSNKLKNLAGLIVGHFSDMKDTTVPFGQSVEEMILEKVKEYNYPVCFNFPVGHDKENVALKIGKTYQLKVGEQISLQEIIST
jgi:muramoyltetrapeptide carboxypeptidase